MAFRPYFATDWDTNPINPSMAMPPIIPNGPLKNAKAATMAAPPAKPDVAIATSKTNPGMPNATNFSTTASIFSLPGKIVYQTNIASLLAASELK